MEKLTSVSIAWGIPFIYLYFIVNRSSPFNPSRHHLFWKSKFPWDCSTCFSFLTFVFNISYFSFIVHAYSLNFPMPIENIWITAFEKLNPSRILDSDKPLKLKAHTESYERKHDVSMVRQNRSTLAGFSWINPWEWNMSQTKWKPGLSRVRLNEN